MKRLRDQNKDQRNDYPGYRRYAKLESNRVTSLQERGGKASHGPASLW